MFRSGLEGPSRGGRAHGRPMKTHDAAPRLALPDKPGIRREGRPATNRLSAAVAAAATALMIAIAACSPGASALPTTSLAVPSVDVSAAASLATEAAVAALDQVDAAIAANETSGALTAEEAGDLQTLATGVRTSLATGDVASARTAVEDLSAKADEYAAKLDNATGQQLSGRNCGPDGGLAGKLTPPRMQPARLPMVSGGPSRIAGARRMNRPTLARPVG